MTRTIHRARPVPVGKQWKLWPVRARVSNIQRVLGTGLLIVAGSGIAVSVHSIKSSNLSGAAARTVPLHSWIAHTTLLTVYGRGFGIAPILGRLGMNQNFSAVARQVRPYEQGILAQNGTRHVRVAIHLIYALATSCTGSANCLSYLDDAGTDIVNQYIRPAARRGWLVILDDQLGRSTPVQEIKRMIRYGYLRYDNVEVAFDPEFRMLPDQVYPGVPVGRVSAAEMNRVAATINAEGERNQLLHRKIMLVHQWLPDMIENRRAIRSNFRYVQPVIIMDGIGAAKDKAQGYNTLLGSKTLPDSTLRGIKLFFASPYEPPGTVDTPVLNWKQIFGHQQIPSGDKQTNLQVIPRVIVIT
ncbi:MAG: hypothetical protein NVSMB22_06700 [Chloroflexota bacterium]